MTTHRPSTPGPPPMHSPLRSPLTAVRLLVVAIVALSATVLAACGASPEPTEEPSPPATFADVEQAARGTTVELHMWGGDEAINDYIDSWVAPRLERQFGITLRRTPVADAADTVSKLLVEREAGREDGSVDLLWINGENFATGADAGLWQRDWAENLPNARFVDWDSPSINQDFGYPVEGREAPWGTAQFVMIHDSAKVPDPPRSMAELVSWVRANPGRFTYPAPPDFTGNAFLIQAMYEATGEVERYGEEFDQAQYDDASARVWDLLNELEPHLWREGTTYPASSTKLDELFADGEVWLSMSYNPQLAQRQVDRGLWPDSTRTYLFDGGTLSNTHYLAMPFNAPNSAGAQVVANFLESPAAQVAKQDPEGWGDLSVLDLDTLPARTARLLSRTGGPAALPADQLQARRLPEARADWLLALQDDWRGSVVAD